MQLAQTLNLVLVALALATQSGMGQEQMGASVKTALIRLTSQMVASLARIQMNVITILAIQTRLALTLSEVIIAIVRMALTRQRRKMEKSYARTLMSVLKILVIPMQLAKTQLVVIYAVAKRGFQAMAHIAQT